jgi:hypothetical protein
MEPHTEATMEANPENYAAVLRTAFPVMGNHPCLLRAICERLFERGFVPNVGQPGDHCDILWEVEPPTVVLGQGDPKEVSEERTRLWDLLHELGHGLDGRPKDRMTASEQLERETRAWAVGWDFAVASDPAIQAFSGDFASHRDWCLSTYRKYGRGT